MNTPRERTAPAGPRNGLLILLALALTGCETCANHPTACAAVTIVAAGCLGLVAGSTNSRHPHNAIPSICTGELSCR